MEHDVSDVAVAHKHELHGKFSGWRGERNLSARLNLKLPYRTKVSHGSI